MIPLHDINPTRSFPLVTYTLVAFNVLVWLYQVSLGPVAGDTLVLRFGMVPYYLTENVHLGSFSTPLTSMFLHGGWLHVIWNMWFLHVFGDNVEDSLGKVRFLVFYLATGLAAAAAQLLVDPSSTVPMVGASGAISGVLGAYVRLFPGARVVTLIPIVFIMLMRQLPAGFFIVFWFATQLLSGFGSLSQIGSGKGGVAFFAHIGGFVAGVALVGWLRAPRRRIGRAPKRVPS